MVNWPVRWECHGVFLAEDLHEFLILCWDVTLSSVVTISTLSVSIPILISLVCIEACFGRVEMGRGPGIAGSDGSSQ